MEFARKGGTVEAIEFTDLPRALAFLGQTPARWAGDNPQDILIGTPTGNLIAHKGDWLVKAAGRVWVVEAAMFAELYEPLASEPFPFEEYRPHEDCRAVLPGAAAQ